MKKKLLVETYVTKLHLKESAAASEPEVLATWEGPFAEYDKPNKNDRLYEEALWDKVIESDHLKDLLKRKVLYGELDHPEDRMTVKTTEMAFCITELKKNPATKTIDGVCKILNTPRGKLMNTLLRFGSVLGMSSRGMGEMHENASGLSVVDPDSFDFITFDCVTDPSNGGALPTLTESVDYSRDTVLKNKYEAVLETIKNGDEKDLKYIESISSEFPEEMASDIINKVEDRRKSIESEIPVDDDADEGPTPEETSQEDPVDNSTDSNNSTPNDEQTQSNEVSKKLDDLITIGNRIADSLEKLLDKLESKQTVELEPEDPVSENIGLVDDQGRQGTLIKPRVKSSVTESSATIPQVESAQIIRQTRIVKPRNERDGLVSQATIASLIK